MIHSAIATFCVTILKVEPPYNEANVKGLPVNCYFVTNLVTFPVLWELSARVAGTDNKE